MKKWRFVGLFIAGAMLLASCGGGDLPFDPSDFDTEINESYVDYTVPITAVTFAAGEDDLTLNKGDTHTYTYTLSPEKATSAGLVWASSDTAVATIANGLLTAVGGGDAVITVSSTSNSFSPVSLDVHVVVPLTSFAVSPESVELGYNATQQLTVTYEPTDTTQAGVTFSGYDTTIISVSESGLITSLAKDGQTDILVSSAFINGTKSVHVNVHETHVSSVTILNKNNNEVEVGHELQLSAEVLPADAYDKEIIWSVEGTGASISATGVFAATEKGTYAVKATSHEDSSKFDTLEVTAYEITADAFEVSATEVNLSNLDPTYQLSIVYTSNGETVTPTKTNPTYVIQSGGDSFSVSASGLLTYTAKGSGVVRVSDSTVSSDYVDVTVNCVTTPTAVTVSGPNTWAAGETVELVVTTLPAFDTLSNPEITWSTSSHGWVLVNVEVVGASVFLSAAAQTYGTITISVDGVAANPFAFTINPPAFEADTVYVVGSRNYSYGFSTSGESWNDPLRAYKMTQQTDNAFAVYEYWCTINFAVDDVWKIRVGDEIKEKEGWTEGEGAYQYGRYKIDEGAFLSGQMAFEVDADGYENVVVKEAGKYDIYYAFYTNENPKGWYEVFVEEHPTLTVSENSVSVEIGDSTTIEAHHWEGTLSAVSGDPGIATVAINDYILTITGVAEGSTTITVSDSSGKEVPVTVTVNDHPVVTPFRLYFDVSHLDWWTGDGAKTYAFIYEEGVGSYSAWPGTEMTPVTGETHVFYLDINLADLSANDHFIFNRVNPSDGTVWNRTSKDQAIAIVEPSDWSTVNCWRITSDGVDYDDGNYTGEWVSYSPTPAATLEISKNNVSVEEGQSDSITASNVTGTLVATPLNPAVATASVVGSTITITGVAEGSTTVTVTDDSGTELSVTVIVSAAAAVSTFRLYFDVSEFNWWTNDSAKTYVFMYKDGVGNHGNWPGEEMTAVTGQTHIFYLEIDVDVLSNYDCFIFNRVNPADNSVWNRTSKDNGIAIAKPSDWTSVNCWKVTHGLDYDDGNYTGSWVNYAG